MWFLSKNIVLPNNNAQTISTVLHFLLIMAYNFISVLCLKQYKKRYPVTIYKWQEIPNKINRKAKKLPNILNDIMIPKSWNW